MTGSKGQARLFLGVRVGPTVGLWELSGEVPGEVDFEVTGDENCPVVGPGGAKKIDRCDGVCCRAMSRK